MDRDGGEGSAAYDESADDSAAYRAYDDGYDDYDDAYDDDGLYEDDRAGDVATNGASGGRALVSRADEQAPALYGEQVTETTLIPGTGVAMGFPFIRRRARPLTMRLATIALVVSVVVTGLLSITPLGEAAQPGVSSFEALSGAVVMLHNTQTANYIWYTARLNDSIAGVANAFHVQVGGIQEMNGLCPSQGLVIGTPYRIPLNSQYGANYASQPPAACASLGPPAGYGYYGQTVFGTNWWNSYAGIPSKEAKCSTASGPNDLDFKFTSPNWNSSWVRGFTFYHDGVDVAAPQGNPIHAVQTGQIIWAGYDATNGFGWSVVINHCFHVASLYGHMMALAPGIKSGAMVTQGQVLGFEGMTGWATGPHCHLTIMWDNVPVNPMLFFPNVYDLTHYVPNP